jgi:2,3-bisphosphoglycerate-independent phosphoglycerate mutase
LKYAIIIPDGCADEPQELLGGKTPLEAARIPAMDAIAAAGVVGRANHVPPSLPPGSEVANMSLLGYDPLRYFTGRAPLEAAAQKITLGPDDWAVRCNLVTIEDQVMKEFTAGHISNEEGKALLRSLNEQIGRPQIEFVPGVSYRNLMLYRDGVLPAPFSADTRTTPPHDLTDKSVLDDYPRGPGSDLLHELMRLSCDVFRDHPVNQRRREAGRPVATNVWLWGLGQRPALRPFAEVYERQGVMISAVDLLFGLAELIGWRCVKVPGATGYLDTDYAAKGRYAIDALSGTDVVCVHVEAPDEASHMGDAAEKIRALERIDECIVRPLHEALRQYGDYRVMITPDHPTPLRTKTHSHGFVPFAIAGSGIPFGGAATYDEPTAAKGPNFPDGWRLMGQFLGDWTGKAE